MDCLNVVVLFEKEYDIMFDYNYDGICEFDNNLLLWWKYGFYVIILFVVIYFVYYYVIKIGVFQVVEYNYQMYQVKLEMDVYKVKVVNLVDEMNVILLMDFLVLVVGKVMFKNNCVVCYGVVGEGGVGFNFMDDYWLYGGDIKDVFKIIKYGYFEKGMKVWEQDFGVKQIYEVVSYIKLLCGINFLNVKELQGDLFKEFEK